MFSRKLRILSLEALVIFGITFATGSAGYILTAESCAGSVILSDEEADMLVGGGGWETYTHNCEWCTAFCAIWCPADTGPKQIQDSYNGEDKKAQHSWSACGGAGWIYDCSIYLSNPPVKCDHP